MGLAQYLQLHCEGWILKAVAEMKTHRVDVCVFRGRTNPLTQLLRLLFQNTIFLLQLQRSVWTQHLMRAVRCKTLSLNPGKSLTQPLD